MLHNASQLYSEETAKSLASYTGANWTALLLLNTKKTKRYYIAVYSGEQQHD